MRLNCRWQNNIKLGLKDRGWKNVEWIRLSQYRDKGLPLSDMQQWNFQVINMQRVSSLSAGTSGYKEGCDPRIQFTGSFPKKEEKKAVFNVCVCVCDPFQIRQTLHQLNLAHNNASISGVTVCPAAVISSKSVLTDRITPSRTERPFFRHAFEKGGRSGISRRAQAFCETKLPHSGTR